VSSADIALNTRRSTPKCHCSAYGVSFANECPMTRGFAACSSAVVRGFTCTMAGNGSSIVRTAEKSVGLVAKLTFWEIVYGTCWPIMFDADGCSGKYVMANPVLRIVVASPNRS
jgi:hypothetical protein